MISEFFIVPTKAQAIILASGSGLNANGVIIIAIAKIFFTIYLSLGLIFFISWIFFELRQAYVCSYDDKKITKNKSSYFEDELSTRFSKIASPFFIFIFLWPGIIIGLIADNFSLVKSISKLVDIYHRHKSPEDYI